MPLQALDGAANHVVPGIGWGVQANIHIEDGIVHIVQLVQVFFRHTLIERRLKADDYGIRMLCGVVHLFAEHENAR